MGDSCGALDMPCHMDNFLRTFATGFSDLAWKMIRDAFSGSAGTLDVNEWQVALDMTSRWAMILLIVVAVLMVVQMSLSALQGNVTGAVSAFFKGIMTWPITIIAVWLAVGLTTVSDDLTVRLMNAGSDSASGVFGGLFDVIDSMFGSKTLFAGDGKAGVLVALMIITFIASLFLSFMLAFRNFALICLVGFAPLAFMAMPLQAGRAWVPKWAQAVVALILAKPIAGGMLVLGVELAKGSSDLWQWMVAMVAMAMASFAPVITLRLFSFMGADAAASYGGQGAAVVTNTGAGAARAGGSVVGIFR